MLLIMGVRKPTVASPECHRFHQKPPGAYKPHSRQQHYSHPRVACLQANQGRSFEKGNTGPAFLSRLGVGHRANRTGANSPNPARAKAALGSAVRFELGVAFSPRSPWGCTSALGVGGSSRGHPPRESLANWLRSSVGRHRHVGHAGGVCGLGRPGAAPSRVDVRSWERDCQRRDAKYVTDSSIRS